MSHRSKKPSNVLAPIVAATSRALALAKPANVKPVKATDQTKAHKTADALEVHVTHIKFMFVAMCLFLNSCIALSQNDLTFIDLEPFAIDMPAFDLQNMQDGSAYSTADHPGAAYVLEFYFNGCPYCNQNSPNVKRLTQEFAGNPLVQILEISIDCSTGEYDEWIRKHSPIGPVLNDCAGDVVGALNVGSYPTTMVFAPNGRQSMRGTGVWSSATYNRIAEFLRQVR